MLSVDEDDVRSVAPDIAEEGGPVERLEAGELSRKRGVHDGRGP
jgi:hypothetical protein